MFYPPVILVFNPRPLSPRERAVRTMDPEDNDAVGCNLLYDLDTTWRQLKEIGEGDNDDLGTGDLEPVDNILHGPDILFLADLRREHGQNSVRKFDLFDGFPVRSISYVCSDGKRPVLERIEHSKTQTKHGNCENQHAPKEIPQNEG